MSARGLGHMKTTLDGRVTIVETITCCHHNTVHEIPFGADRYMCLKCMAYQCEKCERTGLCVPFEKKLGAFEMKIAAARARGQFFQALGID